jgi:hypothetical protein
VDAIITGWQNPPFYKNTASLFSTGCLPGIALLNSEPNVLGFSDPCAHTVALK